MSAFYDLASLVVVPSGYKSGKIYAQKPLTTDGQLTFSRASTATRITSTGALETVSSNVPRLDYTNSNCPKLLLEPQRTNLLRQNNNFDTTWGKVGSTVTTGQSGYATGSNAWKLATDTGGAAHYVTQTFTAASSVTISVYAKAAGYNFMLLYAGGYGGTFFNVSAGIIGGTLGSAPTASTIEAAGNGFYRCSITVPLASDLGIFVANTISNYVFTGDGTSGLIIQNAQVELGAYATSVIPTTTAAVTRLADACSKTGISSLIGSTEGVLYAEVDIKLLQQAGRILLDVNDGNTTNRVLLLLSGSAVEGFVQGSTRVAYTLPSAGVYKFAFAYKSGNFALYVNGVQRSTSTDAVTFSGMNQLFFGHTFNINNTQPVDGIKSALLFKTRLTNAQLAELTAL